MKDLNLRRKKVLGFVDHEMNKQDEKWGYTKAPMPLDKALGILMEEVGEVAKSQIEGQGAYETFVELIHVAAVACQWMLALDAYGDGDLL